MAKKPATEEVTEFPIFLDEFTKERPTYEVEKSVSFHKLMQREGITGPMTRSEWLELYDIFGTMPIGTPWKEWQSNNKGGA